jgi:hypothetical protein
VVSRSGDESEALTWYLTVHRVIREGRVGPPSKELAVEVLVLFACLSGAVGMIAGLFAFILARAGGKSKYAAAREAGVAFIAATTLVILLLNFVGVSKPSPQTPPQPVPASSPAANP